MKRKFLWFISALAIVLAVFVILKIKKGNLVLSASKNEFAPLAAEVKKLQAQGNLLGAKKGYQRLINEFPNSREVMDWQKNIEVINIKLLFSTALIPKTIEYQIRPGDSLEKIAKDYKTTVELIMKSNNLSDDKIYPGKSIRVWVAPFSIVIDKSQNTLILKSDEEIIKTYTVSTGTNNSTPVGTFRIIEKIVNPPWYKESAVIAAGSPENILGSRWMGLDKEGYGIHGTNDPQTLGRQITAGCIRMSNSDVEELYSIVPKDTEVTIVD